MRTSAPTLNNNGNDSIDVLSHASPRSGDLEPMEMVKRLKAALLIDTAALGGGGGVLDKRKYEIEKFLLKLISGEEIS